MQWKYAEWGKLTDRDNCSLLTTVMAVGLGLGRVKEGCQGNVGSGWEKF